LLECKPFKPGLGFNYAHNCLEHLRDVRASLLERLPNLAEWTSWGPGYLREGQNEDEEITHAFGFTFTPRWRVTEPWFSGRLCFHAKGAVHWAVMYDSKKKEDRDFCEFDFESISSLIKSSLGRSVAALDIEKMAAKLAEMAREWHVI